jgi:Domain of unknown function (DUF3854)
MRAMLADLMRSGIKYDDAKLMQVKPLSADATSALTKGAVVIASYKLPYFELDGRVTKYFRLRLLEDVGDGSGAFKGGSSLKSSQRYWQPPNSVPRLYMPPLFSNAPWARIAKDPEIAITITEGEKKSAAACFAGIPCAGLGGVWSFQAKKKAVFLLPDLQGFVWKKRVVDLCFDSDVSGRPDLLAALIKLNRKLLELGAVTRRVDLPELGD